MEERINKTLKEIKSINLNIRGICKAISISKVPFITIRIHCVLYIEKRIDDIEKQDLLSKNKKEKLRNECQNLKALLINPL